MAHARANFPGAAGAQEWNEADQWGRICLGLCSLRRNSSQLYPRILYHRAGVYRARTLQLQIYRTAENYENVDSVLPESPTVDGGPLSDVGLGSQDRNWWNGMRQNNRGVSAITCELAS